jgi:hypothetical protein
MKPIADTIQRGPSPFLSQQPIIAVEAAGETGVVARLCVPRFSVIGSRLQLTAS